MYRRLLMIPLLCAMVAVLATTGAAAGPQQHFPKPIASEVPFYPQEAQAARVQGVVTLWFTVAESGRVTEVHDITGPPMLRKAATETVRSWRFGPGEILPAVRTETRFTYVLKIQEREGEPLLTVSLRDFRNVRVATELYVKPIE